jgi:hypothetical protein
MTGEWTWSGVFSSVLGVFQWTIAIVSVLGTIALVVWILGMILKKDKVQ